MDKNEWKIIRRFQVGDESAFDELVKDFEKRLYNLAWQWTNNKEDALDICQNAFIKLYKILGKWKPESSLYTWLYRVVINMAIDLGRKKIRQRQVPLSSARDRADRELPDTKTSDPFSALDNQELRENIQTAIASLPVRQQKAFVLKHLHGLAIKEIAEIMRCSEGAVKAHTFQATRKLRKRLNPVWREAYRQT